jgi:hypothetical protein
MTTKDDLDLQFAHPPGFPEKFADSFRRDADELNIIVWATLQKIEHIKRSGHYSPKGESDEIGALLVALAKEKKAFETKTLGRVTAVIKEQTEAALQAKSSTEDPQLRFQRLLAKRAKLETADPIDLEMRLRQAVVNGGSGELIEALELLEPEFPIAPKKLIEQTKLAIAERQHPEIGEYGQLKAAYTYILGIAQREMETIAKQSHVDAHQFSASPYLVSTGEPVA